MNQQDQNLKLQALLDGELAADDARAVEQLLAQDTEAKALFDELKLTKMQLAGNEPEFKLPESREFYWSKIEREIQRLDRAEAGVERPVQPLAWLKRWLVPVSGFAAVVLAFTLTQRPLSSDGAFTEVENTLEGVSSTAYHDQSAGITMIWVMDQGALDESHTGEKNSIDNVEKQ